MTAAGPIAGIVMAAGMSKRFGRPDIFLDVDMPEDLARVEALFQESRKVRHQSREDHQDDHA